MREFAEQSPLVRYLLEPKQGVAYARRHAADLSTPWLIFVDDDNLLSKNYLIRAAELIEENPDAGVLNGAGIAAPVPGQRFTADEQQRLFAVAAYLACSHPSADSFRAGMKSMATVPYGAGSFAGGTAQAVFRAGLDQKRGPQRRRPHLRRRWGDHRFCLAGGLPLPLRLRDVFLPPDAQGAARGGLPLAALQWHRPRHVSLPPAGDLRKAPKSLLFCRVLPETAGPPCGGGPSGRSGEENFLSLQSLLLEGL